MFRKDRMGRRGGVLLYIKETIPAYEVQLQEEADCNEAIWCKLVTGHTTVTIGVVYRCPIITKENNEKIHNVISEVSKGDCIIMGEFNHGNTGLDIKLVDAVARGASIFDNLLAPLKTYWPPKKLTGPFLGYISLRYQCIIVIIHRASCISCHSN